MSFSLFLCVSQLLLRTEVEAIGNHAPSLGHRPKNPSPEGRQEREPGHFGPVQGTLGPHLKLGRCTFRESASRSLFRATGEEGHYGCGQHPLTWTSHQILQMGWIDGEKKTLVDDPQRSYTQRHTDTKDTHRHVST